MVFWNGPHYHLRVPLAGSPGLPWLLFSLQLCECVTRCCCSTCTFWRELGLDPNQEDLQACSARRILLWITETWSKWGVYFLVHWVWPHLGLEGNRKGLPLWAIERWYRRYLWGCRLELSWNIWKTIKERYSIVLELLAWQYREVVEIWLWNWFLWLRILALLLTTYVISEASVYISVKWGQDT